MEERIAKITTADLGVEDHGIFTSLIDLDYGGGGQGIPGYDLRGPLAAPYIRAVMAACGVDRWSKVQGRTVLALTENGMVAGLKPLPTETGKPVIFADLAATVTGKAT